MGNYKYIPAAADPNYFNSGIAIKYQKNKNLGLVDKIGNYIQYNIPDRSIFYYTDQYYPNADVYLNCSTLLDEFYEQADTIMLNFHANFEKNINYNLRPNKKSKLTLYCDSGGFQIATDKVSYINPYDVINWYNTNIDYGMCLDIPITFYSEEPEYKYIFNKFAKIHKEHNKIFVENKAPHVKLINIFHGTSIQNRLKYRDMVEMDGFDGLAMSGYITNYVNTIHEIMVLIGSKDSKPYETYHFLGVYNPALVVSLALISKILNVNFTSDSTSYKLAGINRNTYNWINDNPPATLEIGERKKNGIHTTNRNVICNCPICSIVKTYDIFMQEKANPLVSLHNMHTILSYTRFLNEQAQNLSLEEYASFIRKHFKRTAKDYTGINLAIQYLLDYVETGGNFKKLEQKYDYYILKPSKVSNITGLFADDTPEVANPLEFYKKIISNYENKVIDKRKKKTKRNSTFINNNMKKRRNTKTSIKSKKGIL